MTGDVPTDWRRVTLRDICERIDYGYTASAKREPVGPRFLRITDIVPSRIDWSAVPYIASNPKNYEKYRLLEGDIVIARTGATTGFAKYIRGLPDAVFGSYLVRVRIKEEHDSRFVGLVIESDAYKQFIKTNIGGAAQPQANAQVLTSFPMLLPPLPVQRTIAAVVGTYDELVDNNARRIKILEQMAQALYREWFVNFRFPGHEKVKLVASPVGKIPQGWEALTLANVLQQLESGSRPQGGIDSNERGVPSVGAENVIGLGQYDYSKEKFVSRDFFENMRRGHVKNRDVLLYKDGAHIGKKTMFGDGFPHEECCINEHVFILRTNDLCTQAYLFFWLDQPEMTQAIRNLNANAAQPGLNQPGVKSLPILVPARPILEEFDKHVDPMLGQIFDLAKKNSLLRRTRDLSEDVPIAVELRAVHPTAPTRPSAFLLSPPGDARALA